MKTMPKIVMAGLVALAGGLLLYQRHKDLQLGEELLAFQKQQTDSAQRIRNLERERDEATNALALARAESSRANPSETAREVLKLRGEVGVLRQQLALLKSELNTPSDTFPKVLKDPAMRDFMRQSQVNMLKWNFGSVFKELKLTPEQTEKAVQLIADLAQKNMDKMYSVPQGSLSPAEIAKADAERWADLEKTLEPVWGKDGYARFKQFVEEIPAHATVDMLNGQLGANQLSGEQTDKLYKLVKAEPFDLMRGMAQFDDPAFWGPQEHIDEHLMKVAESNQRVLDQAGSFLTPDQLNGLSMVLSNGINNRIKQAAAFIPKHP